MAPYSLFLACLSGEWFSLGPSEFSCATIRAMLPEAEVELWRAVLLRSAEDLAGRDAAAAPEKRRHAQLRARAWFSSHEFSVGSFLWVCDIVGLDADYLRGRLFVLPAVTFRVRIETAATGGDLGEAPAVNHCAARRRRSLSIAA